MERLAKTRGDMQIIPIVLPSATWAGHQFNGWYDAATGGNKVGNAGASYVPTEPTTLYAQWTAYTVSFDGSGATNPSDLSAGSDGTVTLPTPTLTGHTFNGWYSATSGGTKYGAGGASYTPTGNITMHAQWTVNSYKVTITTSNSSTAVTVGGTTVNSGGSVAYNSVVKVELTYSQSNSKTFTITQGSTSVTMYSDEACTKTKSGTDAGTYYFKMPAGDVTINSSSASGGGVCIAEGSLVTMADGTKKPVEQIEVGEMVLTWSFWNGCYEAQPVVHNMYHGTQEWDVLTLKFSDGTSEVDIIGDHGLYDANKHSYVYISIDNVNDYIGDTFIKSTADGKTEEVQLVDYEINKEQKGAYNIISTHNINCFVGDILIVSPEVYAPGLFEYFDIDDNMKFDEEQINREVEQYGFYDYSEFSDYISEEVFEAYNLPYYKIFVERGTVDYDGLVKMIALFL